MAAKWSNPCCATFLVAKLHANSKASAIFQGVCRDRCRMIPALKVSPAPTVSITFSIVDGVAWYVCFVSLSSAEAPLDPSVQNAIALMEWWNEHSFFFFFVYIHNLFTSALTFVVVMAIQSKMNALRWIRDAERTLWRKRQHLPSWGKT